jgi:multicomponent K+:H+ antiporter subunit C
MEAAFAITLGVLCTCGIYLLLCARVLPVILGITLFSYAINLFLLGMGRLSTGKPPVITPGAQYADPVPQALVLTAIVIGFAMTAFTVVLALRALAIDGSDHVDGRNDAAWDRSKAMKGQLRMDRETRGE